MRIVIQRVLSASVSVEHKTISQIDNGLLILLGITEEDTNSDIDWLVNKIINMRIFNDEHGKMNLSVLDVQGDFIVVSQFTLYASTKKGNRPSYLEAAKPDIAIPLYKSFVNTLKTKSKRSVFTGIFGADMKVRLINDGPVTITMDSKDRR